MAEKDLKALFLHLLNDTYSAEKAILKALPEMAQAAQSEELRGAFAVHLKETEEQVKRLERVFQLAGEQVEGVECKAIQAIIEEGQEIREEFEGGEALDAGLIAVAQAVEHYEITRYGTLLAWAKQLGLSDCLSRSSTRQWCASPMGKATFCWRRTSSRTGSMLNDTYSAEKAILKALPEMAQAAQSEELRGAFVSRAPTPL